MTMFYQGPAGECANCNKPIRVTVGETYVIFDHPYEGHHTVCNYRKGMNPTDVVATPKKIEEPRKVDLSWVFENLPSDSTIPFRTNNQEK